MDEKEIGKQAYRQEGQAFRGTINEMSAQPPSARQTLLDRIERLQREAKQLEALYKALPLELPYSANEALLELLYKL